jgi:NTP pyrophosphatase (non-canonical NTP hydrolase)
MDANEYQRLAGRTLSDKPDFEITDDEVMLAWNVMGLAGEAGELAEAVKKMVFHQHGLDREKLAKELGDVCWYVAAVASCLGLSLSDVMETNIEKLRRRYPDGYSPAASMARVDVIKGDR